MFFNQRGHNPSPQHLQRNLSIFHIILSYFQTERIRMLGEIGIRNLNLVLHQVGFSSVFHPDTLIKVNNVLSQKYQINQRNKISGLNFKF